MKLILMSLIVGLVACSNSTTPSPATLVKVTDYGIELEECNRTSTTCAQSIACENDARARHGRPLRDASKGCAK